MSYGQERLKFKVLYFDLLLLEKYWEEERVYHHTAPAMFYAMREGLRIVMRKDSRRIKRHQTLGDYLKMEIENFGFKLFAKRDIVCRC